MDLDIIRFKQPNELTDDEKGFLKANEGSLIDEEKELFKPVLHPEEFTPTPTEGEPPVTPPVAPVTPPVTPPTGLNFQNEAELNTWLETREKKRADDAEHQRILAEQEAEEEKLRKEKAAKVFQFFEQDYKPNDWNEFGNKFLQVFLPVVVEEIRNMDTKEKTRFQAQVDAVNTEFDKETEELKSSGEPVPTTGSPERVTFDKELAKISLEFGISDTDKPMHKAYEIYKYRKAGGVTTPPVTPPTTPPVTPPVNPNVSVAQKVGGGTGQPPAGQPKSYAKIHNRSMDQIVEDAGF
jgi:hypothetical protein